MRKIIISLCLVIWGPALYAQVLNPKGSTYAGQDGALTNKQFNDMGGYPLPINDHSAIDGSPLLNASWGQGIVRLKNGNYFSDSAIAYSLYGDKLFVKRNNLMYPVDQDIASFSIEYPGNGSGSRIFSFQNGFPGIDRNDENTFYQILYHGKDFTLLKWMHEKAELPYNYGVGSRRQYVLQQGYYAYSPTENKMIYLGNKVTLKNLRKKLPQYVSKIETFDNSHKFKGNDQGDIIKLFTFLN